jgi:hypothetical protein
MSPQPGASDENKGGLKVKDVRVGVLLSRGGGGKGATITLLGTGVVGVAETGKALKARTGRVLCGLRFGIEISALDPKAITTSGLSFEETRDEDVAKKGLEKPATFAIIMLLLVLLWFQPAVGESGSSLSRILGHSDVQLTGRANHSATRESWVGVRCAKGHAVLSCPPPPRRVAEWQSWDPACRETGQHSGSRLHHEARGLRVMVPKAPMRSVFSISPSDP